MSAEATGWVFRYSPYTGGAFLVHLCIADSVNDQNHNEFWMRQHKLAHKARLSRPRVNEHIQRIVDDGLLTLLDETTALTGRARRYRFETPDLSTIYDPKGGVPEKNTPPEEGVPKQNTDVPEENTGVFRKGTGGVPSRNTEPNRTQGVTQAHAAASDFEPDPLLVRLLKVCTGPRIRVVRDAPRVLSRLREHFADHVIDEGIGVCELVETPPQFPQYLLKVVQERSEETGLHVPDLFEGFKGDAA